MEELKKQFIQLINETNDERILEYLLQFSTDFIETYSQETHA